MGRTLILSSPWWEHGEHIQTPWQIRVRLLTKSFFNAEYNIQTDTTQEFLSFSLIKTLCTFQRQPGYLLVEVEEPFGTVDVMEGRERLDGAVDAHGVKPHGSPGRDKHPVRRRAADEHLQ